jgi:hypothetical protein
MKALILLTGIALFTSGFMSNEFATANTTVVKAAPTNQQFNYFRGHRMANDVSLNWSISDPVNAASFTVMFSYDLEYWYELDVIPATNSQTYKYRDVTALPGTTHYKVIAMQKDLSFTESPVETVRIVKRK